MMLDPIDKNIQDNNEIAKKEGEKVFEAVKQVIDSDLHIFRIDDGETHWVCASSSEEALRIHAGMFGYSSFHEYVEDYSEPGDSGEMYLNVDVYKLKDDDKFWVRTDSEKVEKTAKEWAENGRGFIASTVF